jgi:hypothetical protein
MTRQTSYIHCDADDMPTINETSDGRPCLSFGKVAKLEVFHPDLRGFAEAILRQLDATDEKAEEAA